ncbi:MAG: methionyl-tRNA formyltransferase [Sphingobacteriaceae bacterium]|nr:methionyl-tRNA formyltransferase [Sphingobacteriaceae bacterium]
MRCILATNKPWHHELFNALSHSGTHEWIRVFERHELSYEHLQSIKPDWIFIPHWSDIIPSSVYENYTCVVFHMTDLPFGRGGSPLQNLIVRGCNETKISAIKVGKGLDTGDIYLKKTLGLKGTAEEIFIRSSSVIHEMIIEILTKNPIPVPQKGEVTLFHRRKPEEGNLKGVKLPVEIYDHIRMLQCEGYPNAFLETDYFKFEFYNAELSADNSILANVRIVKK